MTLRIAVSPILVSAGLGLTSTPGTCRSSIALEERPWLVREEEERENERKEERERGSKTKRINIITYSS